MRFQPNDDQATFLSVIDQMAEGEASAWKTSPEWLRFDWSPSFDALMEANGFLDCAKEESLGLIAATAMVNRVARLPVAAECAASAILRPLFAPDLPRPIAVVEDDARQPVRFLPVARSVLFVADGGVRQAVLNPNAMSPVESLFAYPMGVLAAEGLEWLSVDVDPQRVRDAWRVAVAAEIGGALKGGLDSVLEHVRQRHQFGRPIGSFQAIQHRMADLLVEVEQARSATWNLAAHLDAPDRELHVAATKSLVGRVARRVAEEMIQLHGGIGMTEEYDAAPLARRLIAADARFGDSDHHLERFIALSAADAAPDAGPDAAPDAT